MFGEDSDIFHVHVTPYHGDAGYWEVVVQPETAQVFVPVLRSDRQFAMLHQALQQAQATFSVPLPHLPLSSSLLSSSTSSAPTGAAQAQAENLQAYLSLLTAHPEAAQLDSFVNFISTGPGDASESAPVRRVPPAPPLPSAMVASSSTSSALPRQSSWARVPTLVRAAAQQLNAAGAEKPPATCTRVKVSWIDEDGEHEHELPVLTPSGDMGARVIDIRALGAKTGFFTHDPGFTSTSSCASAITFIDGEKGVLLHRGYPIEQLARACSFPEVAYLLVEGELPSSSELAAFEKELKSHRMVHTKLITFFEGFKSDAHPMAIMVGVCGALSAFYPDSMKIHESEQRRLSAIRLIAKMPTIAAICYKTCIGEPVVYPQDSLSWAENFLYMMFSTPCAPYTVNPTHAKALETIFILHADHEQNASTSTVRIASSSQANPFACIAAGIASLWGPAHGGANEAVLRMLDEIGTPDRIPLFLAKAKDKNDPFRLMGFGHRVYKNFDPRAHLMRSICADVLASVDMKGAPELELASQLEKAALADDYFAARKLYPNVDFYSGIVLRALGIPRDMFTVIFAVARCAGWVAQWHESFADAQLRISRPRQLYVGVPQRDIVSQEMR